LLTHLHYDHVLGLPFFSPMQDPGAVLDVYGPSQQDGSLREVLAGMVRPPFFPISMAEFRGELRCQALLVIRTRFAFSCLQSGSMQSRMPPSLRGKPRLSSSVSGTSRAYA
jgi:ribonuclease BN (tRNA processing enzyme)